MERLREVCVYCNRPVVISGGVAVCVAGPSLCSQGYQAMRQLTAKVNAVKAKRTRERKRRFASGRRF